MGRGPAQAGNLQHRAIAGALRDMSSPGARPARLPVQRYRRVDRQVGAAQPDALANGLRWQRATSRNCVLLTRPTIWAGGPNTYKFLGGSTSRHGYLDIATMATGEVKPTVPASL